MSPSATTRKHRNNERTVNCPIDGCDETPLARGAHLHVLRSAGDGHGPQGEVPNGITFDDLETVGEREVEMDYPEERDNENVARMCPYCEQPFRGKHGVMIHLGQIAGRKNHPKDASKRHEPDDFPIVHVDEHDNIIEKVEDDVELPSRRLRSEPRSPSVNDVNPQRVEEYIASLREQGRDEQAEEAEEILLA